MLLPSFLKSKKKPANRRSAGAAVDDSGPVQAARTQARRRLIGAVVLLAVGVVGFPLIFETQPRPVAVDIPIEVPTRKDAASVAAPPAPAPVRSAAVKPSAPLLAELPPESADGSPAPAPAVALPPAPVAKSPPVVASAPATAVASTAASVAKGDDGNRAKALLEDSGAAKTARFVVQVGAYTDPNALREARQRVEKLGLKTYTQVVDTDAGKRTRVRVGPFASREEADSTGAKLKAAGLPAAILAL